MPVCERCLREIREGDRSDKDPAERLGGIFFNRPCGEKKKILCDECEEEVGMMLMLGVDE